MTVRQSSSAVYVAPTPCAPAEAANTVCGMKTCSKCGSSKEIGDFTKRKSRKDGVDTRCKACNNSAAHAYRLANIDAVREKDRIRAAELSPEARREKHKAWRDANREHVREAGKATMRRLYQANPAKFRERAAEYRRQNPEAVTLGLRQWRAENKHHISEYSKEYRRQKPEAVKAACKAWRLANPDAVRRNKAKQRDELSDSYVRRVMFPDGVPAAVPSDLTDMKREQLTLHRLTKQLKQEITNQLENDNGN